MSDLLKLAERVEAATGPDRELDVFIWADQIGQRPEWQGGCLVVGIEGVVAWIDPGKESRNFYTSRSATGPAGIPAYTASIDAAMQLVPEGWETAIYCAPKGSAGVNANVQMETEEMRRQVSFLPVDSIAATPALALTAAALRARAASVDRSGEAIETGTGSTEGESAVTAKRADAQ